MQKPWYTFRSTLDKLADHLNGIEADGDEVVKVEHVGGRDWVILCRKTPVRERGIPREVAS